MNVTVAGTSLHSTTDGSGHFMLTNVPAGSVRLQLSGAGLSGEVQIQDVADQDTIEVDIESQGGALEVQNEEHDHGSESELEGKVTSVNLGAQSFVVGQTTVLASGASITDGFRALAFTDIVVGARVHVRGSKSGSTLTAMQIEVQQSTLDKVEDSGPATDLGSACPDLTFKIGSQAIAVNASTIFVKGTCGDIVSGVIVDVKGLKRTDGSILATQLKFESDHAGGGDSGGTGDNGGDSADVELTGTVSGLGGGCPAITFLAGGRTVMTTGATTFDTPCATIANGLKVQVNGKAASGNGPVAATRVKVQD